MDACRSAPPPTPLTVSIALVGEEAILVSRLAAFRDVLGLAEGAFEVSQKALHDCSRCGPPGAGLEAMRATRRAATGGAG